ncbi:histidine kinase dimerization/phospho-acceptor domain-containing protein [Devosia sp. XK-2]|uniref:sensor histidine kinase n=1 Tax=Devosia sp. XK-2 TaxID=3126689 RepID=UPI0030D1DE06
MAQANEVATRQRQSMDDRWNNLPDARRVQQHEDDSRPAWLWSQDGQRLIWSNAAAALFHAKVKKHGLKRAAPAAPIKGQVARIIRLGSMGRTSLARIQFLAGEKPLSATCATTPLNWEDHEAVLLIVGVDPIAPDVLEAAQAESAQLPAAELAEKTDAEPGDSAAMAQEAVAPEGTAAPIAEDAAYLRELQSWQEGDAETAYAPAEPHQPPAGTDDPEHWSDALDEQEADSAAAAPAEVTSIFEAIAAVAEDQALDEDAPEEAQETGPAPDGAEEDLRGVSRRLSELVEKLADDEALYTPLTEADDTPPMPVETPKESAEPETEAPADDLVQALTTQFYKITGRGFTPGAAHEAEPAQTATEPPPPDPEQVERVSRYNFDELSRILNDRVGERSQSAAAPAEPALPAGQSPGNSGALVNLGGETLVLNRLPLGILVFRDQQVLFANRAITEMVGYDSVESLRHAGLGAIFPVMGTEGREAGPVNHLVQRDGTLVPVTARLQSISWHGRPALMLSASTTEVRTGHEDAVKAFAQTFADIRGDGFLEANRNGMVSAASAAATAMLSGGKPMTGRPISALVARDDAVALRAFLERPARFAETARPCLTLRSEDGKADILLFAQGQAGVVSGYFGLVKLRDISPARIGSASDIDPALLGRISRGVRRPLNTIIGFSDIIRSKAFGELENERYAAYADDIAQAGQEIAALVDELDDYARLRDGRYLPQRASLDMTGLLEQCVLRIRDQANGARVIVRNAISEMLPRVTADRASLAQAVLNLLASAIDQTPMGGAVVISAQRHDDGSIAIHVRDGSANAVDMAERFVVFRDGVGREGQILRPVRSSVGLALTRSLLAVNAVSLSVDPAGAEGMLFTLKIPADLVDERRLIEASEDAEEAE